MGPTADNAPARPAASSLRARLLTALVALILAGIAFRFACKGFFEAVLLAVGQLGTMGEYSPTTVGVALRLLLAPPATVMCGQIVFKVLHDLDQHVERTRVRRIRVALVSAATAVWLLLLGAHHQSHAGFLHEIGEHDAPFEGTYPFRADSEKVYRRFGLEGLAHFDARGFRVCGPPHNRPDEAPLVTTIGDSMVFGLVLDDPDTLCWMLRDHFDKQAPLRWQNMGTPGLSLRSYVENARSLVARGETDLWVVGVLIGNDGQVIDLYTRDRLTRHPLYVASAAFLDPYLPMALAVAFVKIGRAEGFELISTIDALRDLNTLSIDSGARIVLFFYDDPSGNHARTGVQHAYVAEAEALASTNPDLHFVGVLSPPDAQRQAMMIPDGHPNGAGNRWYTDQLIPHIERVLERMVP